MTDLRAAFLLGAEREFDGSSPTYALLARVIAERPELASPLLSAPEPLRRPLLLFGAVQYALRTTAAGHPLAGYYPALGGTASPGAGLVDAFTDLVKTHWDVLSGLCARRTTQTNEVRRAAQLRPAFGYAASLAGDRPLSLVELGTSAGVLLVPDLTEQETELRGPEPGYLDRDLRIGGRTGIDLAPVRPGDTEGETWLRACVWPEHTERLARLDAALATRATADITWIAGDMVDAVPGAIGAVPGDHLPVVFASNAVCYLDEPARLVQALAATGRDLVLILNEAPPAGLALLTDDPVPFDAPGVLVSAEISGGQLVRARALAGTGAHGAWLDWGPKALNPRTLPV
ncbi:DUF2332 domain-containing protein [Longispora albida]|uniref:DUF2332 domain-containing protein n=1 Tax=Longispora albida TaxID=203523 RepID=UPI000382983B|nr:DUF2332 domain-containing protein [Longispora albida]